MPAAPAEMVPLLLMPPEKVEMTANAFWDAWPPTKMPLALAEIVALLRMPPTKVASVTDPLERATPPTKMPEPVVAEIAAVADAAGERGKDSSCVAECLAADKDAINARRDRPVVADAAGEVPQRE